MGMLKAARNRASQNPAVVYLDRYAQRSRETMRSCLKSLCGDEGEPESYPWGSLTYNDVVAVRAQLMETKAPATANLYMVALRGVLREAFLLDMIPASEWEKIRTVKRINGDSARAGREELVTAPEIDAAIDDIEADENYPRNVRDAAMLAILYGTGIRRAELASLDLSDYNMSTNEITVRGKRNKFRTLSLNEWAIGLLNEWINLRGGVDGPLFVRIRRGGYVDAVSEQSRLSGKGVWLVVTERTANLKEGRLTPHDLRRALASDLLDRNVDIVTVRDLLGHESTDTTAKYDRRPAGRMRTALAQVRR